MTRNLAEAIQDLGNLRQKPRFFEIDQIELHEFVELAFEARLERFDYRAKELFRNECLAGHATCWGVPVRVRK